jgi:hypothetical protein
MATRFRLSTSRTPSPSLEARTRVSKVLTTKADYEIDGTITSPLYVHPEEFATSVPRLVIISGSSL